MSLHSQLHALDLSEVAALIASRQLSPVDLVAAALDRISVLDPRLHAFITLTPDSALAQAKAAESELARGRYRGPLHGIPIAHKDIVSTEGVRTTAHSRSLIDWVPSENATVVERLREAGAISLGKTSLHEFGIGSPGVDEAFPPARNPWNPEHMPGSSSSGSATAVASGFVWGATGTDTGGSVRHPAAACGIVGMKPTYGRVSCYGVLPLAHSMDHVGPLTRSVFDNALMLQAMAGFDPKDPASLKMKAPCFALQIGRGLQGMHLGIPGRFIKSIPHEPEVLAAFDAAKAVLGDLGATFAEVDPEGLVDAFDAGTLIIRYEGYRYHREQLDRKPENYGENMRARFIGAEKISGRDYEEAKACMNLVRRSMAKIHESGIDLIINPGRERPAQTMKELYADPLGKRSGALRIHSVTGNPAMVQPMGFSSQGLPLALQLAGPPLREDLIYRVAAAYERATQWHNRRPDLDAL